MYYTLLTVHLICAALWLGGAVYERLFLVGNLLKARGSGQEWPLLRMMLSTEMYFMSATVLLLLTGIALTVWSGAGFFRMSWVGFKQGVMVAVLLVFAGYVAPRMKQLKKSLHPKKDRTVTFPESSFETIREMTRGLDIIHLGVVINVVLAAWRPF